MPNHEDIIECTNRKSIIYFCKGHCSNEIFLKKLNKQIEIADSNIMQGYGEMYVERLRGLVLKVLDDENTKSFPITYVKTNR